MSFGQWTFLMQESFRTVGRHKGVMAVSVVIMSLSLLVLAVFLLVTDNVLSLLDRTRQDFEVYVYVEEELSNRQVEILHTTLLGMTEVATLDYISKAEALEEFRGELGDDDYILEMLETNPLPASFRVSLEPDQRDDVSIAAFAERAAALNGVEEVNYGREFLERFSFLARIVLYVDGALGVIVILSSVFIISNTVRLTIMSRIKSIEILKLVGATNRFITAPFIMEGAMQGAVASLVSLGLLGIIFSASQRLLPDAAFLGADKIILYIMTCIALGSLGSYMALRRFLKL